MDICRIVVLFGLLCILRTNGQNITSSPTPPSQSPTARPSKMPTIEPTAYPSVSGVDEDYLIVVQAVVPVNKLTTTDAGDEQLYFESLFADSCQLDLNDVDVEFVKAVAYDDTDEDEPYCNSTGVKIFFEIASYDSATYTSIRQNIDTDYFTTTFDAGLANVYNDRYMICFVDGFNNIIRNYTIEAYDDVYPPTDPPTFTEDMWSEYLFFGFFTSLFGVVWLWYLRTDVDDDNIYVSNDKQTRVATNQTSDVANDNNNYSGGTLKATNADVEMTGTKDVQGSQNALLDNDETTSNKKLSDYAVKNDDGKLVLDQRDSDRSP